MSTRCDWGADGVLRRRMHFGALACALLVAGMVPALLAQSSPQSVAAGRNVNMVSGTTWPTGDPFLQRQNEPSVAVSTRNPLHMLAGANDYRAVDMPGLIGDTETGDAWLGVFKSFDGGERWQSTLLPGDPYGLAPSTLSGYTTAADPVVRAGAHGMFFYSGLAFDRVDNGRSAIFVSRFIDNNNLEAGDPIAYLGTSIVTSSPAGSNRFLDKPWMAVDIPRGTSTTCRITVPPPASTTHAAAKRPASVPPPQSIMAGAMYVAYTAITHASDGSVASAGIFLSTSADCGVTWSSPVRVSRPQDPINQGATIAINPVNGDLYVAWRRLSAPGGSDTDAFLVARSTTQGRKFSNPGVARRFPNGRKKGLSLERYFEHRKSGEAREVGELAEFDQATSADWLTFRTNAYPTMAFDDQGRLYLAWAERGYAEFNGSPVAGDARIMLTTTRDGMVFTLPRPIDNHPAPGHQIMPTMAYAGGKLVLVYYDLREDASDVFGPYIDDWSALQSGSRHTIDIRATLAPPADEPEFAASTQVSAYLRGSSRGELTVRQLQFNPPNLPLFKLGTVPFVGDYIDVAPAPAFIRGADGRWRYNTSSSNAPLFHSVWTDNRDVRPPSHGDWSSYTKPDPQAAEPCDIGTRNQNIYTSRLSTGLMAGSPGNTKPLNMQFPRAFVVYARNTTDSLKYFRMTIAGQPPGGRASFQEYPLPPYTAATPPPLTAINVAVPRRSAVARTVYLTSIDPTARVAVDVAQVGTVSDTTPLAGGLRAQVVLNPEIENPEIENPEIENPEIENPEIENAEVFNPEIENPEIENPEIENPEIENPEIENPEIENPEIENPEIENPEIENPEIENPEIENGTITDVTWTVKNNGNTTAAFNVDLFFKNQAPNLTGIKLQLILYRTYKTPIAAGCAVKERTHNVIFANILNPTIGVRTTATMRSGSAQTPKAAGEPQALAPETPALWIEPGGTARITLRIYDTDRTDDVTFDPTSVTPVVTAQSANIDATSGTPIVTPPPSSSPDPAPEVPQLAFAVQPSSGPVGLALPEFSVSVMKNGTPVPGVSVLIAFGANPAGARLTGATTVTSDGTGLARFTELTLSKEGSGFQFVASAAAADAVPVVSATFDSQPLSFAVTNTNDSGTGSLRQAILNANAHAGLDTITFNIPAPGPFSIAPLSPLPNITDAAVIDGTTQPGYAGVPMVYLDGTLAGGSASGLRVTGGAGSTIRGLIVSWFGRYGIELASDGNTVVGNWVGTDVTGTAPRKNYSGGIWVSSAYNRIGGTTPADRNVVSGNAAAGITLYQAGAHDNSATGNYVGTNAAGTGAVWNGQGIFVNGGVSNTIGGAAPGAGNLVSGNTGIGVSISGASAVGNRILGNYIGLNAAGTAAIGNGGGGIFVAAPNTTIGGSVAGAGNVVSGNTGTGISVSGANSVVQGNIVGLNATGMVARPNTSSGISVSGADVLIGGSSAIVRNVVSGNGGEGITVSLAGTGARIKGNYVGLDVTGSGTVSNGNGVSLRANDCVVGGATDADRNVISGNGTGIEIAGTDTLFQNNYVGTNAAGTAARPNTIYGVQVTGLRARIAQNLISGNTIAGLALYWGDSATVVNNLIGTDVTGTTALGNDFGLWITYGSNFSVIGGTAAADRNVISGNRTGVLMSGGPASTGNIITGNYIGVARDGVTPLPNITGLRLDSNDGGPVDNRIGGTGAGEANIIANNTSKQVTAWGGTGNQLIGNVILPPLGSTQVGIDLSPDGPTPNDAGDVDAGPNGLQNYPVLAWADNTSAPPGFTRLSWSLNSKPGLTYTIQLFRNLNCAAPGQRAEAVLDTFDVTLDGAGNFSQLRDLPLLPVGTGITATATGADGTSEISPCAQVVESAGVRLSGTIYYSTSGLAGVPVSMGLEPSGSNPALKTTTTDGAGFYYFDNVAAGTYWVSVTSPSPEYVSLTSSYVAVAASPVTRNIDLPKIITQTAPANNEPGVGLTPTLTWAVIPEAVRYNLQIVIPSPWTEVHIGVAYSPYYSVPAGVLNATTTYQWSVSATDGAGHNVGTTTASFRFTTGAGAGPLGSLVFTTMPPTAEGGQGITGITVAATDGLGEPVPGALVTLAIANNPGSGALSGTFTATTNPSGVALFNNASINRGGYGYTLTASSGAVTSTPSTALDVAGFARSVAAPARGLPSIAKLGDGRVLIAGGWGSSPALASAEIYDPVTHTVTATAGSMSVGRVGASATLLPNGKVLIAGGADAGGLHLSSAELFDPATGLFSSTGAMGTTRSGHSAVLLPNGKVFIIGGNAGIKGEIYDPQTGTFAQSTRDMLETRYHGQSVTLLRNGQILIAGGYSGGSSFLSGAETFDPASGIFERVASMHATRTNHTAVLLPDGKVLVVGGDDGAGTYHATAEVYDPSGGWTDVPVPMPGGGRAAPAATMLPSGQVLLAGGGNGSNVFETAIVFDPVTRAFRATGSMATARAYGHSLILLGNGLVLAAGGQSGVGSVELFHPLGPPYPVAGFESGPALVTARRQHSATVLGNGLVLIAGGYDSSGTALSSAELCDPVAGTCTIIGSAMATARARHTATLLPSGKVLIAGGYIDATTQTATAELFSPSGRIFVATGSMNALRYSHSATRLPDGRVLIVGGTSSHSGEIFDPAGNGGVGSFSVTASTHDQNLGLYNTALLLPNGKVWISGGGGLDGPFTDLFDPATGMFSSGPSLSYRTAAEGQTMTLLGNGKVLVAGGWAVSAAVVYDPVSGLVTAAGNLNTTRCSPTATLLPNGKVLFTGGSASPVGTIPVTTVELFDPSGAGSFTMIGSLTTSRWGHTGVLLPQSGKAFIAGGSSGSGALGTTELYRPK